MITLAQALKDNRLSEFIAQEEARGIGSVDRSEFDALAKDLVKAPQSEDQTSHCSSGDGSSGKQTRQGNARRVSR